MIETSGDFLKQRENQKDKVRSANALTVEEILLPEAESLLACFEIQHETGLTEISIGRLLLAPPRLVLFHSPSV